MTHRVRRGAGVLLLPTIGLAVAITVAPRSAVLEVHVWLLVVLALAMAGLLAFVAAACPNAASPFQASLRRPPDDVERPAALARLEREVSMAGSSAFDVHYRLRPTIVELAGGLLSSRRGIDLEREPDRARAALGDDVWELVRPDRPAPVEHLGSGIAPSQLEHVVDALEGI